MKTYLNLILLLIWLPVLQGQNNTPMKSIQEFGVLPENRGY